MSKSSPGFFSRLFGGAPSASQGITAVSGGVAASGQISAHGAAAATSARALWQYPLPEGPVACRYISGPLADGSGDQDALIEVDQRVTPWGAPFVMKQLPTTLAGSVHGKMHRHPYPELIGWFSTNPDNNMELCGSVTFYIGEEMEQHTFDAPTMIYIPPNVPHGVVVYGGDIKRPLMHINTFPDGKEGEVEYLPELDARLPDFRHGLPTKEQNPPGGDAPWNPAGGGQYGKYFFSGLKPNPLVPMPASQLYLFPGDIPGVPMEKGVLFIYTWEDEAMNDVPMHITHAHPFNENLVYFSTDSNEPHDLGATVTIYAFDPTIKKLVPVDMNKPFVSCSARGKHLHCPIIRRNMRRKLGFIWYGRDYDPTTFAKGPEFGVSMQYHNGHYTNGLFNLADYGVRPEDMPDDAEGDGGFLTKLEPHTGWPVTKGHDGINAPKLKVDRSKVRRAGAGAAPVEVVVPSASSSTGQPTAAVDGMWDCEVKTPMGIEAAELRLQVQGNVLLGDSTGKDGNAPLVDGRIEGDKLSWRYELKKPFRIMMRAEVTVSGDTLNGTVKLPGLGKMPFTAKRRVAG